MEVQHAGRCQLRAGRQHDLHLIVARSAKTIESKAAVARGRRRRHHAAVLVEQLNDETSQPRLEAAILYAVAIFVEENLPAGQSFEEEDVGLQASNVGVPLDNVGQSCLLNLQELLAT